MGKGRSEKWKYCVRVCLTAGLILMLQCRKPLVAEPAEPAGSLTWEVSLADLVLEHSTGRQSLPLHLPAPFQRSGSSTQSQNPLRMTMTLIEAWCFFTSSTAREEKHVQTVITHNCSHKVTKSLCEEKFYKILL